jgi:hypothetical protein
VSKLQTRSLRDRFSFEVIALLVNMIWMTVSFSVSKKRAPCALAFRHVDVAPNCTSTAYCPVLMGSYVSYAQRVTNGRNKSIDDQG